MKDEKVILTAEQAKQLLPAKEYIHTFRSAPGILVGADWKKTELEAEIEKCCCELAGPAATEMKHGLCIHVDGKPLFVETI